jgi:glycerol-3-phosphate dehydrogenase
MDARARSLEQLHTQRFDLLVVGAGIVGARIAYEAASAGLSVAMVDAGDFAGATSSASSKLLHGGFRYLGRFRFGLVRQAQRERRVLAERVASHLVRPCPLVVVVPNRKRSRRLKLAAGVALYDALGGAQRPRHRLLALGEVPLLLPALEPAGIGAAALVHEMQTNDARLTLTTVEGAARAGATVVNYARVVAIDGPTALVEDVLDGGREVVHFRSVINAAGPWLESIRQLDDPSSKPITRLSKGVHAFLAAPMGWRAGIALFDEHRSAFAVPWQGLLLLGATDEPFDGDPSEAVATAEDVRQLLTALERMLPPQLAQGDVFSTSVGLRVLPRGRGRSSDAPREHVVERSATGMVSVGGGKLTTHRLVALAALEQLPESLRPRRLGATNTPLPGALAGEEHGFSGVDRETAAYLVATYGSRATEVGRYTREDSSLLERIRDDGPDIWAQARFAVEREWAMTADDVLMRRTTAGLRGSYGPDLRAQLVDRLPDLRAAPHASN